MSNIEHRIMNDEVDDENGHPIYAGALFSIVFGSGGKTQCRKPQRAHTNTSAVFASQSVSKNVSTFVFNNALRVLKRS